MGCPVSTRRECHESGLFRGQGGQSGEDRFVRERASFALGRLGVHLRQHLLGVAAKVLAVEDATVARVAPAVLALLGDGVPRSRRAIVAALAERHPRDEVARTLMRLAVTGRLAEIGGKYTLAGTGEAGQE